MNNDAKILLDDALSILQDLGFDQRKLAMLKSCEPVDLTEDTIVLATKAGFVKKTIEESGDTIEQALTEAAFGPMKLIVELRRDAEVMPAPAPAVAPAPAPADPKPAPAPQPAPTPSRSARPATHFAETVTPQRKPNPLAEAVPDSELTFATFVEGEENRIALVAAKQVANGVTSGFNPLFIYGRSGLGKTHLLKAIQNYLVVNEPERVCVYRTASEFLSDYQDAMRAVRTSKESNAISELEHNYRNVDVLIIDDIQLLKNAQRTVDFFFSIFNYLHDQGRQIIVAADRTPAELGTQLGFDERVTSRVGGGFQVGIEIPSFELKSLLIESFLEREAGVTQSHVTISQDCINYMAERAGNNIRSIKAFCVAALFEAEKRERAGGELTKDDISELAKRHFGATQRRVGVREIQQAVETEWGVSHDDLVGSKRNKEFMEARHVAIWLSRVLTNNTLAEVGAQFGGRSHGTIKHSIAWVEDAQVNNPEFNERVGRVRAELLEG